MLLPIRVLLLSLPALAAFAQPNFQPGGEPAVIDRIVAVVNDGVILDSELDAFVRTIQAQLRERSTPLPPEEVLRKQALERLVIQRLQMQLAERTGIRVDDETVNRAVRSIAQRNNLTLEQFRRALEQDGFSFARFREDIRDEIIISRLQQRNVDNRIEVSEQEVDNLLARREVLGSEDNQYRLSHILIAVPEAPSPEQVRAARQKAHRVLGELRAGADFARTAVSVSDGQQALEGGSLGWFQAGRLPTAFVDAVVNMRPGEISDVIRSPSGFHIIKLEDLKGRERHIVRQTRVRHILLRTSEIRSDADARRQLRQLRERLLGGADFTGLARAHSDDTLSARKGGGLGWVGPGETVPRFEQALDRLAVGEVSEPVRTRFGWHLIQVMERREHDDTEKFLRAKAHELIRGRKRQEALELWLRRLRDEAYVEYRLGS